MGQALSTAPTRQGWEGLPGPGGGGSFSCRSCGLKRKPRPHPSPALLCYRPGVKAGEVPPVSPAGVAQRPLVTLHCGAETILRRPRSQRHHPGAQQPVLSAAPQLQDTCNSFHVLLPPPPPHDFPGQPWVPGQAALGPSLFLLPALCSASWCDEEAVRTGKKEGVGGKEVPSLPPLAFPLSASSSFFSSSSLFVCFCFNTALSFMACNSAFFFFLR